MGIMDVYESAASPPEAEIPQSCSSSVSTLPLDTSRLFVASRNVFTPKHFPTFLLFALILLCSKIFSHD